MKPHKTIICDRCSETIYKRNINLDHLVKYNTDSKEAYIESIVSLEGVNYLIAKSWAEHGLFELCQKRKRNCPVCNTSLKTWRAKLCTKCGAKFKPLKHQI